MPAPAYYRGRPARFWIAIMSGPGRAAEANQDAAASPASQRPAAAGLGRQLVACGGARSAVRDDATERQPALTADPAERNCSATSR
jgi:hypothetical protein